jgi:hypothetical protein
VFSDRFRFVHGLPGDRIGTCYFKKTYGNGDVMYVWIETLNGGEFELVVSENADRYNLCLTYAVDTYGKSHVGLEKALMTFDKNPNSILKDGMERIFRELHENLGAPFDDIVGRFWKSFKLGLGCTGNTCRTSCPNGQKQDGGK